MCACTAQFPAQWVKCDVRKFPLQVGGGAAGGAAVRVFARGACVQLLGEFPVIMADPPWDIHMEVCAPSAVAWCAA